jgi:hypothetical protein
MHACCGTYWSFQGKHFWLQSKNCMWRRKCIYILLRRKLLSNHPLKLIATYTEFNAIPFYTTVILGQKELHCLYKGCVCVCVCVCVCINPSYLYYWIGKILSLVVVYNYFVLNYISHGWPIRSFSPFTINSRCTYRKEIITCCNIYVHMGNQSQG